jgi:carbonic anhydrase
VQFHFHGPSEERVRGERYSMVAHLVHKNAQGDLAVVAVLIRAGNENAFLKAVFDNFPPSGTAADRGRRRDA